MASLMPNGKQQYTDPKSGLPLAFGLLYTFEAGTLDQKVTWADADEGTENPNPISLDANGTATVFWDDGFYDIQLKTRHGQLVYTASKLAAGVTLISDAAPTAPPDTSPKQGLSFAINTVVDVARMANNFGSGGNDSAAMGKAIRYAAENGGKMYLRGGTTAKLGALDWSGVREFSGDGEDASFILPSGSLASAAQLITFTNATGVHLHDFSVSLDTTLYPTQLPIHLQNPTDVTIENVHIPGGGACGIRSVGATKLTLRRIRVDSYVDLGLFANTSGSRVVFADCEVVGTGTSHAMQVIGGGLHEIRGCYTQGAKIFGAVFDLCDGVVITDNTFKDGHVECCAVQDTSRFQITNNRGYQITDGTATDFGMSVAAIDGTTAFGLISGNFITQCFKSGIALDNVQHVTVNDNVIFSPNQADEVQGAGVLLYGSSCQQNTVQNNAVTDQTGKMRWGINEFNDGGAPSNNYLKTGRTIGASLGEIHVESVNTEAWDSDWINFTATAALTTSGGGALASPVVTKALIKRKGKECVVTGAFTSDPGSGSGAVEMAIPFAATSNGGVGTGVDKFNGNTLRIEAQGGFLTIRKTDNSFPVVAGSLISFTVAFEIV